MGPSLGARSSNEFGMHGEFATYIAPLVINSEKASIATQSSVRKSDQS